MRAFPPTAPSAVRLTVDEGAIVIGLLDFLVEPALRASPDVIGLAHRTRRRVSLAVTTAMSEARADVNARLDRLRNDFNELQLAFRDQSQRVEDTIATAEELRAIARSVRALVGETGGVSIDAADDRLQALRADLARMAA